MGRKPNQLILEYFDRGAKLEDASNRYQHTCKSCGEHFPKGRIDSLTTHLTRKCPSLSHNERAAIVLRMHDLMDPSENKSPSTNGTMLGSERAVTLPYSPSKQNFNGLNVLAEASRRVGANDRPRTEAYAPAEDTQTILVDPALEVDGFPHAFLNHVEDNFAPKTTGFPLTNGQVLSPLLPYLSPEAAPSHQASPTSTPVTLGGPSVSTQPPDLSTIAASANEILPMETDLDISSEAISAALFNSFQNVQANHDAQTKDLRRISAPSFPSPRHQMKEPESVDGQFDDLQSPLERIAQHLRPIAMNPISKPTHFVSESGTSSKSQKPKVRGRFTFERRKEVQQIRKKGACIRCRMLKKSCSDKTPCDACSGVESPRMWKQPCVRSKLVNEFTLFFVGLNSNLAFHDVSNFKAQTSLEPFEGHLEVFQMEAPRSRMALKAIRGRESHELLEGGASMEMQQPVYLLDGENDDLPVKVENCLHEGQSDISHYESLPFLKTTLAFAATISDEKNDALLRKVLDLWTMTLLLTDGNMKWNVRTISSISIDPANSLLVKQTTQAQSFQIDQESSPYSYSLISSQLRAAIEKRAAICCRSVMNELERRLLQRQQTSRFETFLVAIVLLNCIERMCWLFRSWDYPPLSTQWPMDKKPGSYAEQGDQFAEMLHMLLEMRSLSPRVILNSEDIFVAQANEIEPIRRWYEDLRISPGFLSSCDNAQFDPRNPHSLDGKYFGRILRP